MSSDKPPEEKKTKAEGEGKAKKPKAGAEAPKKEIPGPAPPAPETPPPPPPPPPPPVMEDRRDFWDTAATYLKKAKDEVVRSSRIGKLRLDIARLKKQRRDHFADLGERSYELLTTKSLSAEALEELKVAVDEKNALIAAKEAEIEAIAAEEAEGGEK